MNQEKQLRRAARRGQIPLPSLNNTVSWGLGVEIDTGKVNTLTQIN